MVSIVTFVCKCVGYHLHALVFAANKAYCTLVATCHY